MFLLDKPYTHYMPNDEKNPFEINDTDMVLEKLGDIERVMTMRLTQANKQGMDDRQDMELMNQLLVKVGSKIDEIKNLKLNMDGVEKVTIQGKQGEKGDRGDDGADCDPMDVARILVETDEFIAKIKGEKGDPGESIKGDKGDDGKTPQKGVDYNTAEEKEQFKSEVIDAIEVEIPNKIKKAVKEYIKMDDIVAKVNQLVSKKTIKAEDVEGLAEMFKTEIDKVYESISAYSTKRGGGGSLLLAALGDIDFTNLQNGYVLKYDAVAKRFYFGPVTGGSGTYYENIGLNIQNGATVITTGYKGLLFAPNGGTIRNYKIQSYEQNTGNDITGSIQITVKKNGSAIGTIVLDSEASRTQTDLSAWSSTTLSRGDKIEFIVDSATGVKNVHLSINFELA